MSELPDDSSGVIGGGVVYNRDAPPSGRITVSEEGLEQWADVALLVSCWDNDFYEGRGEVVGPGTWQKLRVPATVEGEAERNARGDGVDDEGAQQVNVHAEAGHGDSLRAG